MKKLFGIEEVKKRILNGENLILAGDEKLLSALPKGNWIAGTIPYFMADEGGVFTIDKIFVDEVPEYVKNISIRFYDEETLPSIAKDEFDNGYSMLIIPAQSIIHKSFAENSIHYENILLNPLVGWISGVDLNDLGKISPKVFNGILGESSNSQAVVMHIELPADKIPTLDIINLFNQSADDTLTFDVSGFSVTDCYVNGIKQNLSEYLLKKNVDTRLPLVANYCGAMVNSSFQNVDKEGGTVTFYAPVFTGVEYKLAEPIENYVKEFTSLASSLKTNPVFTCNCILNYLYSELEGKKTASITGPITFGEIAYQLLNQTLVYLTINDI
jgi:hypothetical protein